jgi:hypothetical protein
MPVTLVLVLAIIGGANSAYVAARNTATIVKAMKAVHHYTTKPLYQHVLKPTGKAIKTAAQ